MDRSRLRGHRILKRVSTFFMIENRWPDVLTLFPRFHDLSASKHDRKTWGRPFDSIHDILRSLCLAQSLLEDQNASIWGIWNRWVYTDINHMINLYKSDSCKNGARCLRKNPTEFHCDCAAGYHGNICQFGPCEPDPCKYGKCEIMKLESGVSYSCACDDGFFGNFCENSLAHLSNR